MCLQKQLMYFILTYEFLSKKLVWTARFKITVYILCKRLEPVQRPVLTDILLCYFLNITELPVIQSQQNPSSDMNHYAHSGNEIYQQVSSSV